MAMIKCSECRKEISDKAPACPNCGCPMEDIKNQIAEKEAKIAEELKTKEDEKRAKVIVAEAKKQERAEAIKALQPKDKKKGIIIAVCVLVVLIGVAIYGWYFGIKVPHDKAVVAYQESVQKYIEAVNSYNTRIDAYNDKAKEIIKINYDYLSVIDTAQALIDCGDTPYEGEKITYLSNTLKDARNNKTTTPELKERIAEVTADSTISSKNKSEIEEIISVNDKEAEQLCAEITTIDNDLNSLVVPEYSDFIKKIEDESKELEDSYAIQKQITAPTEEWIITRLGRVENIANMAPVTEENDPNGNLNKDGGYISTVYFGTPLLETTELSGNPLIDKGTVAGGAIEVYRKAEEAENRSSYLGGFDGGIFASGSHTVLGTILIRTSDELKASEQQTLTNAIIEAFIALD